MGFWSKIGGALKKVGKVALKVGKVAAPIALGMTGIGIPAAMAIGGGLNALDRKVSGGSWGDALKSGISGAATGALGSIGGKAGAGLFGKIGSKLGIGGSNAIKSRLLSGTGDLVSKVNGGGSNWMKLLGGINKVGNAAKIMGGNSSSRQFSYNGLPYAYGPGNSQGNYGGGQQATGVDRTGLRINNRRNYTIGGNGFVNPRIYGGQVNNPYAMY